MTRGAFRHTIGCSLLLIVVTVASAQDVPIGFADTIVLSGLDEPVDLDWDPDGGLWVVGKQGEVWVHRAPTTTLAATLTVETVSDAGIGAIRIDPDYSNNAYVWIQYTTPTENRISRFSNSNDTLTAETVIFSHQLWSPAYNGGCIQFHPDGTVFVSTGMDGAPGQASDPFEVRGKMLRMNQDGTAPPDNPYADGVNGHPLVYASGFRNIFRCTLQPGTLALFGSDVGSNEWEEVNIVTAGGTYGFPTSEGPEPPGLSITYPFYDYFHDPVHTTYAVIGGEFAPAGDFPPEFVGDYYFADHNRKKIMRMVLAPGNSLVSVEDWATELRHPAAVRFGPDNALYYTAFTRDEVHRIAYVGGFGSGGRISGLQIAKTPETDDHDIILSWNPSCLSGDTDYALHRGTMPGWGHWTGTVCSTGGLTTQQITPGLSSKFFLVAPHNGSAQGSFGTNSEGDERVPSTLDCFAQALAACPP